LAPLKYYRGSYTINLSGDTKYFLTSLSLAATKITIINSDPHPAGAVYPVVTLRVFPDRRSSRKGEEESLSRKERKIVKKGGELIQIVNGFIRKGDE
jgi:hypothetical protein